MADRPRGSGGRRTRCAGCIAVCVVRTTRFEPLQFFLCCLPAGSSSGNPIVQREYAETLISGGGGTSASSPAFAGVMALVNQKTGSRLGNANYVLYKLAAEQNASACNSAIGSGSSCIFNDVTTRSIAIPCKPGTQD